MDLISVRELFKNMEAYSGREVTIGGWVRSVRASKQFGFIVLNDGTFFTPSRWSIMTPWKISRKFPK